MDYSVYKNINWNECVYLYRTYGLKSLETLLNNFYFSYVFKWVNNSLIRWNTSYEYNDLMLIGYQYFRESIFKIDYKNKNFVNWSTNCVINALRNYLRKTECKKTVWNYLVTTKIESFSNEATDDESELKRNDINKKSQFLKNEVKRINSDLFNQILKYKVEDLTLDEIAKKLNLRFNQVRGCWNYYRKLIFKNYKNKYKD